MTEKNKNKSLKKPHQPKSKAKTTQEPLEIGGPKGPEPTRYGDWSVKGRVSDF